MLLWGPGGIGKSTMAQAVYDQLASGFGAGCQASVEMGMDSSDEQVRPAFDILDQPGTFGCTDCIAWYCR